MTVGALTPTLSAISRLLAVGFLRMAFACELAHHNRAFVFSGDARARPNSSMIAFAPPEPTKKRAPQMAADAF